MANLSSPPTRRNTRNRQQQPARLPEELLVGDPEPQHEKPSALYDAKIRGWVAIAALAVLGVTFAGAFWLVVLGQWADAKDIVYAFLAVEGTIIGGIVGYYFKQ